MSVSVSQILGDPGPSVATTDVDAAIIGCLKANYGHWLRIEAFERDLVKGLPAPRGASYANAIDQDEWLDHASPAVLVTTSKTRDKPMRRPDGTYSATWDVAISVVVRGTSGPDTRDRASLYEVALRRCLGHRSVVANAGGIVHAMHWESSNVVPVATVSRSGRYLAAGMTTWTAITDYALKDSGTFPAPVPDDQPLPVYVPEVPVTVVDTDQINGVSPTQDLGG